MRRRIGSVLMVLAAAAGCRCSPAAQPGVGAAAPGAGGAPDGPSAALAGAEPSSSGAGSATGLSAETRDRRVTSEDVLVGSGMTAQRGKGVEFHYVIRLGDGTVALDTHHPGGDAPGKPRLLELGKGDMIPAVEDAMIGMGAGGKRRIFVPSHLAYGPNRVGAVPPDADLSVEVELLRVYEQ